MADTLDKWVSSSICSPVISDSLDSAALDYWVDSSICSPVVTAAAPAATVPPLLEGHMLTGGFQTQGM